MIGGSRQTLTLRQAGPGQPRAVPQADGTNNNNNNN